MTWWLIRNLITKVIRIINISHNRCGNIPHNELGMTNVSDRWVLPPLTFDQKRARLLSSRNILTLFQADPADFLEHVLNQDECWRYYFKSQTKRQSMQWKLPSSPSSKNAKVVSCAVKVDGLIFWKRWCVVCVQGWPVCRDARIVVCVCVMTLVKNVCGCVDNGV